MVVSLVLLHCFTLSYPMMFYIMHKVHKRKRKGIWLISLYATLLSRDNQSIFGMEHANI